MFIQSFETVEAAFYRNVNQVIEPFVRAGVGSPGLWPVGTIVIETTGRKSGRKSNVPLLAARVGNLLVVSTVRRRSQWLKNIAANPNIRYWMGGKASDATAVVIATGSISSPTDGLPLLANWLIATLKPHSDLFGTGFAILIPQSCAVR